jgi:hypothetical protein
MGKLVRAGQIFVTSLDATPRESDILTGLASIDAGEITADEIQVANLKITGELTSTSDTTQFAGTTNVNRLTATQVGIGTDNPINDLQIGTNSLIVNRTVQNLVTVQGNVVSTNLFATDTFKTTNDKFLVDATASNVLTIDGNVASTNATITKQLTVGTDVTAGTDSNVAVFENGNVVVRDGFLRVFGNVDISGNLAITEIPSYTSVDNLVVSNAVIQMGKGNNGTYDMAVLMRDGAPDTGNVFLGYTHADDQFKLSRTYGTPEDANFTMDSANTVNLHVFGDVYTQNNVGIANTSPAFSLSVGSNVYINDVASSSANVLHANGYGFFEGLRIGDDGLTVGSLITLDADAAIPMVVASKIQSHAIQTTGATPSGIANTNSTNMLSIGDKIFINADSANLITVLGNTATGRLITQSILVQDFIEVEGESGISSAANVIIHGDISGEDSTANTVSFRCGPLTSNISAIELKGAKTSANSQTIVFKTRNTERMRVASDGKVGLSNTEPSELLTLGGNLKLNGSNAAILGSDTNYLKAFTDITGNQTRIENRVGSGKGLSFYASTTGTMGTPKLTILESSNVGVNTINPEGILHTNGGTVFINDQVANRGTTSHLDTPLVVSNTTAIVGISDFNNVIQLAREGGSGRDGVRSIFKMGKHDLSSGTSRSQLNLSLASDDYETESHVMTWRSNKRVGIGTTTPTAHLEILGTGIGNFNTNGLLVHNIEGTPGDAIMAARTSSLNSNAFASFAQTDGDTGSSIANPVGYSVGLAGALRNGTRVADFRITKNPNVIDESGTVQLFIDGANGNMGIGTDIPRDSLEVNGNVVIGNKLSFTGVSSDEFGNTFITERLYDSLGKSELVIFKGNDRTGTAAPDRIRSIAAEHLFQTYNTTLPSLSTNQIQSALNGDGSVVSRAMTITPSGVVVIGALPLDDQGELDVSSATRFYVGGGLEFAQDQSLKFGALDIFTAAVGPVNLIESIGNAPLVFRQKVSGTSTEYARFTNEGLVGFGTNSPESNVHIYSDATGDIDILKLQNPGTNNKVGLTLNTNDNYGGYVRGFSDSTHSVHGTVIGAVNNGAEGDGIHIIHTSNVGVGTVNPSEHFTVYNGTARLEHATSNAILEFKTTGGVSNIYGDHTGNVFVDPVRSFIVNSDTEIVGDLQIDGKIDLGNQVAVDLGGVDATTALEVGGGFISNSNEVACKRYSKTFTRTNQESQDVQLRFNNNSFYAKIVAILRSDFNVNDMSTLVIEVQGGTRDGATPSENITMGNKSLFGGGNLHPWNPTVTTGKNGILFAPEVTSGRTYYYDLFVEVITSVGGKLVEVRTNNPATDNFSGTQLVTFTH